MSIKEAGENKPWYTELIGEPGLREDGTSWQRVLGVDGNKYWLVTGHNKSSYSQPDELIYPVIDKRYRRAFNSVT